MPDIVITVPKTFRWGGKVGLAAWVAEGCLPGDDDGELFDFTTWGTRPNIKPGELVYVVCEGKLRGYAPLVALEHHAKVGPFGRLTLTRGGGAVAVTIPESITGFRGWRYRWWKIEDELSFHDWTIP